MTPIHTPMYAATRENQYWRAREELGAAACGKSGQRLAALLNLVKAIPSPSHVYIHGRLTATLTTQARHQLPTANHPPARRQARIPVVTRRAPGSGRCATPRSATQSAIAPSSAAALPPSFHQLATVTSVVGSKAGSAGSVLGSADVGAVGAALVGAAVMPVAGTIGLALVELSAGGRAWAAGADAAGGSPCCVSNQRSAALVVTGSSPVIATNQPRSRMQPAKPASSVAAARQLRSSAAIESGPAPRLKVTLPQPASTATRPMIRIVVGLTRAGLHAR